MSNPFTIFRKHQKKSIAALGVLCMVAFTILPVVMQMFDNRTRSPSTTAVSTRYGDISEGLLTHLQAQRRLVKSFLFQARLPTLPDVSQFGQISSEEQRNYYQAVFQLQLERQIDDMFGPDTEEAVVDGWIMAREAERMGIVISDDAVLQFIRDQTQNRVDGAMLDNLVVSLRATHTMLFDALRRELAAHAARDELQPSAKLTPDQRWEYYRRLNARATVELFPVRVEDYVSQVPEPSQQELATFFNEHRDDLPVPGSPTPGFKEPKKCVVQFFEAAPDQFIDESSVTDEEIENHYEQFKETRYQYTGFSEAPSTTLESSSSEFSTEDSETTQPAVDSPESSPETSPESSTDSSSSESPAATDANPSGDAPPVEDEGGPALELPGGDASPPPDESTAAPHDGVNEPAVAEDSRQFVAYWQASDDTTAASQPPTAETGTGTGETSVSEPEAPATADSQAAGSTEAETATTTATSADATSSDSTGADSKSTEPGTAAGEPSAELPPAPPPLPEPFELPRDVRGGPDPKYDPLWKVEDQIRTELAGEHAREKIETVFNELREKMRAYKSSRVRWEIGAGEEDRPPEPKPLDFDALAAEYGLTTRTTGLASQLEFRQVEGIGTATLAGSTGGAELAVHLFSDSPLFDPVIAEDVDGRRYLAWKIREVAEHVPEMADVQEKVIHAWKMIQAYDLALERARAVADQARKKPGPLKEAIEGDAALAVTESDSFSWLEPALGGMFNQSAMPEISEVKGVDEPGEDFMEDVFSLEVGEIGVTSNQPHTMAYVVRMTSLSPSRDALRESFYNEEHSRGMNPTSDPPYATVAYLEAEKSRQSWIKEVRSDAKVVWKRPPRIPTR